MPVRDLAIALALIALIIISAFLASYFGSEFYLYVPSRRRTASPPPTTPWMLPILYGLAVGVFFASRRYSAMMVTSYFVLALLGLPIGSGVYEWTPGFIHYFLIVAMGGLTIFVWTSDDLQGE